MLSEWAVMETDEGLAVNYYGPMTATAPLKDGRDVTIRQETRYPLDGRIRLSVSPKEPRRFVLKLRIPAWIRHASVHLPDIKSLVGQPGTYVYIDRLWKPGDVVEIDFDMPLRYIAGDGPMFGRMCIYRGPLLLAFDTLENDFDETDLPPLTPDVLNNARLSFPKKKAAETRIGRFSPWIHVDLPLADGRTLRLVDFASAGSLGSRYASWLPAKELPPPVPVCDEPADGAHVPPGRMLFTLRQPPTEAKDRAHEIVIADNPDFQDSVARFDAGTATRIVIPAEKTATMKPGQAYFWKLIAKNPFGQTESEAPTKRFVLDDSLSPLTDAMLTPFGERSDGTLIEASLSGTPEPAFGELKLAQGWKPAKGPNGEPDQAIELDGKKGMLTYTLKAFPPEQYTISLWFSYPKREPRLGQLFSAWCRGMDDPLRICIQNGQLSTRIEAGRRYDGKPIPVDPGKWYHVCVAKSGPELTLYLDGREVSHMDVPAEIRTQARDFALGGNPHYTGSSEHLACQVADLQVSIRAFTPEEVANSHAE